MDFKAWEMQAVSEQTLQVSRDWTRDVYRFPNGVIVYHEVCMPWNPFQPQHEQTVVDKVVSVEDAERLGINLDTDRYTEPGFGLPMFRGEDSLEQAYKFAVN